MVQPTLNKHMCATASLRLPVQLLTPGDCFAEVPFFTQTANMEAVRTLDVSRVMLVPRAAYDSIAKEFIMGSQQVCEV